MSVFLARLMRDSYVMSYCGVRGRGNIKKTKGKENDINIMSSSLIHVFVPAERNFEMFHNGSKNMFDRKQSENSRGLTDDFGTK